MLLARIGGEYWSHVGSANGSETAHRYNREVGLSVESESLFEYLAEVFRADWERAGGGDAVLAGAEAEGTIGGLPETWRAGLRR